MENRNFKLDTEWNMIHYPEKPKGFGILIIGDERHFVDEKSSFWTQNEGKLAVIEKFKNEGYTVFYSNLYGKNWGSEKAVQLAKRLYQYIMRTEIINDKIHVIAEGMGALVALKLLQEMEGNIRSAILVNPVLSLKNHLEQEKEHKFFYKKLLKELSSSYEREGKHVVEMISNKQDSPELVSNVPIKIIHVLAGNRAYKQSNLLKELSVKWQDEKAPITVCYMLPEKKLGIGSQMIKFLRKHEKVL
ncbi:serine aminopeptidase domain-containing protein [Cytobacillus sp. FJAT-54145]|uniref:Serine aminopeptidase domain-containing protein n=1 Tax=Cytobacillus spartinae TaxID=3299023 RepID=A0ABW6K882_9BACI